jgi:hypothetical protein
MLKQVVEEDVEVLIAVEGHKMGGVAGTVWAEAPECIIPFKIVKGL